MLTGKHGGGVPVEYFRVGKIVRPQGLRGEVRVVITTDFVQERFKPGTTLYAFIPDDSRATGFKDPLPLKVERARPHKDMMLVKFAGLDRIEDVEPLRAAELKIASADRSPLPEGEYYFDEIIGSQVYLESGERLGEVKEILQPGANDVWVIKRPGKKDLLLPYIEACIVTVDVPGRKVVARLLPGLDEDGDEPS